MRLRFIRYLTLLLLAGGVALQSGQAQTMPRTVVGSAGSFYSNLQFGDLHFTVGEIAVSRYIDNGMELDEGFHRMFYDQLLVDAREIPALDWDVKLYPNPVSSRLYLEISIEQPVRVLLYNVYGQMVLHEEGIIRYGSLDLSALAAGAYWLRLLDEQGQQGIYQIQKVSF